MSRRTSGSSGGSYSEPRPVRFSSSPASAFAYRPFVSRSAASPAGMSTNTSRNSPSAKSERAVSRSARNGETNAASTISPASAISFATSPARRMFSARSASVKPRSFESPWRRLSPSSRNVCLPSARSRRSTRFATDDLPAPGRPVSQTTNGRWPSAAARMSRSTSTACQVTFCERRSANCKSPAPTVAFVIRSIRMKPPVSRLAAYGSNAIGSPSSSSTTPISFSCSSSAAIRSSVSTLSLCLIGATVAGTVFAPTRIR